MRYIFIIALLCNSQASFAQTNFCGTSVEDQRISLEQMDNLDYTKKDFSISYIPLMVHNVGNDNSLGFFAPWNLFETLCTLNEDLASSGIQFFLEKDFNYIKNTSWNDHAEFEKGEEMMRQSNVRNMANCYLVANPAGNCGYFTYRGDGVALNKSCLGKRSHTWAHEMGHYFSLPHTFYGWEGVQYSNSKNTEEYQSRVFTNIENVNRDNCSNQADKFCDTQPDYISNRWTCGNDGFSNTKLKDKLDSTFRVDGSLFMSYSNDDCMNRFSMEQMDAMNKNIQGPRTSLKRPNVIPKFITKSNFSLQFPIDSLLVSTSNILLSWDKVENAKYYVLQISRTEKFTIVIKNLLLTEPFTVIDSLIQGKSYWWRVRAFSEFDFCGAESVVGIFNTEPTITSTENVNRFNSLSPNPVSSYEFIQIPSFGNSASNKILIQDVHGKSHSTFKILSGYSSDKTVIELEAMSDGLYLLSLIGNNERRVFKMVVKNK